MRALRADIGDQRADMDRLVALTRDLDVIDIARSSPTDKFERVIDLIVDAGRALDSFRSASRARPCRPPPANG